MSREGKKKKKKATHNIIFSTFLICLPPRLLMAEKPCEERGRKLFFCAQIDQSSLKSGEHPGSTPTSEFDLLCKLI